MMIPDKLLSLVSCGNVNHIIVDTTNTNAIIRGKELPLDIPFLFSFTALILLFINTITSITKKTITNDTINYSYNNNLTIIVIISRLIITVLILPTNSS